MLNWQMFLTFLTVVLIIMGSVHGYLYARLVVATALPDPWSSLLALLLAGAVLSIPLSFIAIRKLDRKVARFFVVPVFVWLGFVFQTFFLVLGIDIVRWMGSLLLRLTGADPLFSDPAIARRSIEQLARSLGRHARIPERAGSLYLHSESRLRVLMYSARSPRRRSRGWSGPQRRSGALRACASAGPILERNGGGQPGRR